MSHVSSAPQTQVASGTLLDSAAQEISEAYGDAGDAPGEVGVGGGPGVAFPQWLHHLQVLGLS